MQHSIIIEKAIEYNSLLEKYSIPTTERVTLISAVLLALHDKDFRNGYQDQKSITELTDFILKSCENYLVNNNIDKGRVSSVLNIYKSIRNHKITTTYALPSELAYASENNSLLSLFITDIDNSIFELIDKNKTGTDLFGIFYSEFIKYAGSDSKTGLVLTPSHITELFCDLVDMNENDVVYDPCCGTGGFLVAALKRMVLLASDNEEKIDRIKSKQVFGSDIRADMFTYSFSSMMMHSDGKSNVYYADCFNEEHREFIHSKNPTVVMLNPPYSVGASGQLDFVINALEALQKGGRCIAIVQMSCALTGDKNIVEKHRILLQKHTLVSVISLPDELFIPVATVSTCIMVFQAFEPHKTNTWFGYWKDDGLRKDKHKGRVDLGDYRLRKELLLDNYLKAEKIGFSVIRKISYFDEWCSESYMDIDNTNLSETCFIDTMRSYLSIMFLFGKLTTVSNRSFSNTQLKKTEKFGRFKLSYSTVTNEGIFKIVKGERLNKEERKEGKVPFLTSTAMYNGVADFIDKEYFIDRKKLRKNNITIDMFANVFYQGYEYFADDNVHSLIFTKDDKNVYIKMYIATILKKLKIKYAYGRQVRLKRLEEEFIYLPIKNDGTPNWLYMEDYIKSLPYSASLD